jgi:hypothetical protein
LSKGGDTFYFGEKVPVWTILRSNPGNVSKVTYDWECTGGVFDGHATQHLYENLWIAPRTVGEYTVQVSAKMGDQTETRQTNMKVTNFYTDTFDDTRNPGGWTQGTSLLLSWDVGRMILQNTSNGREGTCFKQFPVADNLVPPFSIQVQMDYSAYRSGVTSVSSMTGTTFYLSFYQPSINPEKPYVRNITWTFCPVAATENSQLTIEHLTPENGRSGTLLSALIRNGALSFGADETHTLTLTVDEDLQLRISCDGQIIHNTDAIRNFVDKYEIVQDFNVREFRYQLPAKTIANAPTGETGWNIRRVQINDSHTAIGGDVNNIGFEELP